MPEITIYQGNAFRAAVDFITERNSSFGGLRQDAAKFLSDLIESGVHNEKMISVTSGGFLVTFHREEETDELSIGIYVDPRIHWDQNKPFLGNQLSSWERLTKSDDDPG